VVSDFRTSRAAVLPAGAERVPEPDETPRPDRPVVLVVDDEELVGTMLHLLLQQLGCEAVLARSGPEAVDRYRARGHFALVLLDVRMPGMDGLETLKALQATDPDVACCFMTGDTGKYSEEELLRCGARHLLKKPFHIDEIREVLRRWAFTVAVPAWERD
jgi:CheY-like chemotaxis protein